MNRKQASIAKGMEGIDHSPVDPKALRRLRKTGRGPAGPSEKAVGRLAGHEAARAAGKKAAQLARRRELAAEKRAAADRERARTGDMEA